MLVYNPTSEKHVLKALGKHFEFGPDQVKSVNDEIGQFMVISKAYLGLVPLPDKCVDEPNSAESKEARAKAKKEGISKRVEFLLSIVRNHQVSLRQDLDRANIKSDVDAFASPGELEAYRNLAKYQASGEDEEKKRAEEIKKLRDQINKKSE